MCFHQNCSFTAVTNFVLCLFRVATVSKDGTWKLWDTDGECVFRPFTPGLSLLRNACVDESFWSPCVLELKVACRWCETLLLSHDGYHLMLSCLWRGAGLVGTEIITSNISYVGSFLSILFFILPSSFVVCLLAPKEGSFCRKHSCIIVSLLSIVMVSTFPLICSINNFKGFIKCKILSIEVIVSAYRHTCRHLHMQAYWLYKA